MGGIKYIPFHPEHSRQLGNTSAELLYEYLCFVADGAVKDSEGYFGISVRRVVEATALSVAKQRTALKVLAGKGWVTYKVSVLSSPTTHYKIERSNEHTTKKHLQKVIQGYRLGRR